MSGVSDGTTLLMQTAEICIMLDAARIQEVAHASTAYSSIIFSATVRARQDKRQLAPIPQAQGGYSYCRCLSQQHAQSP